MFGIKSWINREVKREMDLAAWADSVAVKALLPPEPRVCETCGCLVGPGHEVRGDSVIETDTRYARRGCIAYTQDVEMVREVYYCKSHAPTEEK
jgi:hypothetical protein